MHAFCCRLIYRSGQSIFFKVRKRQLRKFLGSFRNRKSANVLGVPVRKSQIRNLLCFTYKSQICKFLQNTAQLCLNTIIKVVFLKDFCDMYTFELGHYMLYLWGEIVCICGFVEVLRSQITKDWSRNSQLREVPHLRKVRKSNKRFQVRKFADLRFAELICGPPTFANLAPTSHSLHSPFLP